MSYSWLEQVLFVFIFLFLVINVAAGQIVYRYISKLMKLQYESVSSFPKGTEIIESKL